MKLNFSKYEEVKNNGHYSILGNMGIIVKKTRKKGAMRIICLIILFLGCVECFSQKLVHGFFEIRILKEELGMTLDCNPSFFCYKLSCGMDRDSLINSIKSNESSGQDVAFLIKKEKPIGYEITDSCVNVIDLPPICNYYTKSNPRYVYKLYEIEGFACDIKLSTSKMLHNEEFMNVIGYDIDLKKNSFIAYYFYNLYFSECVQY